MTRFEYWANDPINLRMAAGVLVSGRWIETLPGGCEMIYDSKLQPREVRGTKDDPWICLVPRSGSGTLFFRQREISGAEVLTLRDAFLMLAEIAQSRLGRTPVMHIRLSVRQMGLLTFPKEEIPEHLEELGLSEGELAFALDDPQLAVYLEHLFQTDDPHNFRARVENIEFVNSMKDPRSSVAVVEMYWYFEPEPNFRLEFFVRAA